jgi:hypothetical protein
LSRAGARKAASDRRLAAELTLRLGASVTSADSRALDLGDEKQVREFAENFLAPMVW